MTTNQREIQQIYQKSKLFHTVSLRVQVYETPSVSRTYAHTRVRCIALHIYRKRKKVCLALSLAAVSFHSRKQSYFGPCQLESPRNLKYAEFTCLYFCIGFMALDTYVRQVLVNGYCITLVVDTVFVRI